MGCIYSKNCFERSSGSLNASKLQTSGVAEAPVQAAAPVSSLASEGEREDHVNYMTAARNSDGITRLERVSSQFLPPDRSRTVKVPHVNYELRYSYLSQRGFYPEFLDKANQDSFCIHTPFGTSPDHFFGVFDGHGEFGAQCSQFVKRKLCENLLRNSWFHMDAAEACNAAFLLTNSQLHADVLDDSMSGTTAITVLVRGRTIYVANTGDSRAVIAERQGTKLVAVDLSVDQTPFRADELERVKQCGARVLSLDQIEGLKDPEIQHWGMEGGEDGDPPRVWVQSGMYPGTAFTRSIGDSIAESVGVVATPEMVVLDLTSNHPFFVLASDGVFEFLSSQAVVDMVAEFDDPCDACAAIVAESYRLWLQYETRTDDITVIVVHVNGLTDADYVQSGPTFPILLSPKVSETKECESSSTMSSWNSKNQCVRNELSRTRLRAIESSLENGHSWIPSSLPHRKTWEEEAHIESALHDHFLFRKLTDSQSQVLLDCMQRVEVKAGDVVVQQGGEGDCFYVVGSGEYEVKTTQIEENGKEVTKILHRYTAEKLSSFGELALMSNKPLQASVHAVTSGTLWSLKREDFRGILMSEFSNLSSLKLLRSVDLLSRLTILQLSRISDSLLEVSFSDGQTIIDKNECLSALYIIQKGQVKSREINEHVLELPEGSHFGKWALLGEQITSLSVVALGSVICTLITKETFDSAVGTLPKLQLHSNKSKSYLNSLEDGADIDAAKVDKVQLSDLDWRIGLSETDCSEVGIVQLKGSGNIFTLKRFSKKKTKQLGKETHAQKEKDLIKNLSGSSFVPQVICTCVDELYAGILLDIHIACSLASLLHTPIDEPSARFCAASVVVALNEVHESSILYRGVSADLLMFDYSGHLQLIDFRYGKKLSEERTFTLCGVADYLAPEIIQGKGHGIPADWWALGVLIYFMLQSEVPFGTWRETELEVIARINKGHFTLPHTFSIEVVDLITKLLEVDDSARLGSHGIDPIKNHPWFDGIDWQGIADHTAPVPQEITSRIAYHLGNHREETEVSVSPFQDAAEIDSSQWFEDW